MTSTRPPGGPKSIEGWLPCDSLPKSWRLRKSGFLGFAAEVAPLMSSLAISLIVFGCVFGGALVGMFLRSRLPEHHLSPESKEVVKVGAALISTMSALVLGLMVASAKSSY